MDASVPSGPKVARTKKRVRALDQVRGKVARALQLAAASDPNVGGSVGSFARRRVGAMSLRCQRRVRIVRALSDDVGVAGLAKQRLPLALSCALRFASRHCFVRARSDDVVLEGSAKLVGTDRLRSAGAVAASSAKRLPARVLGLVSVGTDRARSDDAALQGLAARLDADSASKQRWDGLAQSDDAAIAKRLPARVLRLVSVGTDRAPAATAGFAMLARVQMKRVGSVSAPPGRTLRARIAAAATAELVSSTRAGTGRTARRFVHQRLVAAMPLPRGAAKTPPRSAVAMRRPLKVPPSWGLRLMAADCAKP
jgi:hypothetical protein